MISAPQIEYFNICGYKLYIYGIILAVAILVAAQLCAKLSEKYTTIKNIYDIETLTIIFGIIGARLYYCMLNFSHYIKEPLQILNIREGGQSIHGAIIFGAIFLFIFSKIKKINFFEITDLFSVGLLVAQAIGRWGNYFNCEAFGLPSNGIFKMFVPPIHRPIEYINCSYFHPTFLYESVLDIAAFLIIYNVFKVHYKKRGLTTSLYFIFYSVIRLLIEPLRIDCAKYINNIPVPIIISVILLGIGVFLFIHTTKKYSSSK